MVRFLTSIGITEVDDFDLDFEMVGYDRFKKDQLNMVIVKDTPWKYSYLRRFQDGLNTITYKYLLRFSYKVRPNYIDVLSLFEDWYQTIYRLPHNLNVLGDDNGYIRIEYEDEAEQEQYKSQINDFRSFLDFLSYEFVIVETIKPKEEEVTVSDRKMKQIVKEAEKEAAKEALELEKQRTKTEKAKQGKGKMIIGTLVSIILIAACTAAATWILSIFMPDAVQRAISVFIK